MENRDADPDELRVSVAPIPGPQTDIVPRSSAKLQPLLDSTAKYSAEKCFASVVQLFVWKTEPDYLMPWQMKHQKSSTSSGFIIDGGWILTNAHCVEHATSILVRRHGMATKFPATVITIGFDWDLAILTVPDPKFWIGSVPLEFDDVPNLQEPCLVIGYPLGGESICVTQGVVSRVEVGHHFQREPLMVLQIDAAINPGNSGGPAVKEGKVVGVAFSKISSADNVGYLIATPIVLHFLQDVQRQGTARGVCSLGVDAQDLENPHLREYCSVGESQTGLYVRHVSELSPAHGVLKRADVILAIDGVSIENDGTIEFRKGQRILCNHIVTMKFPGDTCHLRILREGKESEIDVTVGVPERLVPFHFSTYPPTPLQYYVFGGLVFLPLSLRYMQQLTRKRKLPLGLFRYAGCPEEGPSQSGEQIVILAQILAANLNMGYRGMHNRRVLRVNSQPVYSLDNLARIVMTCTDKYVRFEVEGAGDVVLLKESAEAAEQEILVMHNIKHASSAARIANSLVSAADGVQPPKRPRVY